MAILRSPFGARIARSALGTGLLLLALSAGKTSSADGADERALRAAAVYNLMLFVAWPPEALADGADAALCVVSDDRETVRAFVTLAGKTVSGRPLAVQRRGPLADLAGCHAAYFDTLEPGLLADKLAGLKSQPVLTLASNGFGSGAMIDLALEDNRLVFEVSSTGLREAGLSLAARVMQLARKVRH